MKPSSNATLDEHAIASGGFCVGCSDSETRSIEDKTNGNVSEMSACPSGTIIQDKAKQSQETCHPELVSGSHQWQDAEHRTTISNKFIQRFSMTKPCHTALVAVSKSFKQPRHVIARSGFCVGCSDNETRSIEDKTNGNVSEMSACPSGTIIQDKAKQSQETCHPELVWQSEQTKDEFCEPASRVAGSPANLVNKQDSEHSRTTSKEYIERFRMTKPYCFSMTLCNLRIIKIFDYYGKAGAD